VALGPSVHRPPLGHVRQVGPRNRSQRGEVRDLLFGRAQPDAIGIFDNGVEDHQGLEHRVSRRRWGCRTQPSGNEWSCRKRR
jgi:hypothetical protein